MRLSPLRALTVTGLTLCLALVVTPTAPASPTSVVDIAHRGSSGAAPENTIAAVELALRQNASYVEVDIQRTADGELVAVHDTTLERTTDVEEVFPARAPWRVGDFTLAELRQLDAGSWFSDEFAGERIPTLREVVDSLGRRAGLLLEVKSPELYPGIERDIDKELAAIPGYLTSAVAAGRLVVQSFDHESMRRFHDLQPAVPIGLLYSDRPDESDLAEAKGWAAQINPSYRVTDAELVERVHELDMTISVYTLNDAATMRAYRDIGVDGIISDYPDVLRGVLYERG
ncbi:hypothetical protein H0B56_11295 [Haloechinothrix sp. YIM 98757]|uniref:GP-PDE domain-containing protein n=1 Tax=Haloechinothrix aidingensis TaxID=2752311 RepID=A0A837ZZU6_9PSEU|nr:glycerophosphodiester phosphodiesterase family protein [Haloechinothrix aidingensis]MBA0126126.1 hypothetical protein [Haloechinothrix aidingensis]